MWSLAIADVTQGAQGALRPVAGKPWTSIIPDPDTYVWKFVSSRPGYRYRGMTQLQQRFYNYLVAKRRAGKPLSFADRTMVRWLQSKRRWPEAPAPNGFWKAYMRYLRNLDRKQLNFAEEVMLSQLRARGFLPSDTKPSAFQRRLIDYLQAGPFRPHNWFESTFGRVEPLLAQWVAASGCDMSGRATSAGPVFPAEPFNGMQITVAVSGASLGPPKDTSGFGTRRWYEGVVTGKTLSMVGTASMSSGYGATVTISLNAGSKRAEDRRELKRGESWSFSLSVPVDDAAQAANFSVKMDGHYSMGGGWRGLSVGGKLGRSKEARDAAWAAWRQHVDELLKHIGYKETPEGKALAELRQAASSTDDQWKAYVDRQLKQLGYEDDTRQGKECAALSAALADPEAWAQYVKKQGLNPSDAGASPPANTSGASGQQGGNAAAASEAAGGGLQVGTAVDGGKLTGAALVFRSPQRLATVVTFKDLPKDTELVAVWTRDGKQLIRSRQQVSGNGWASFSVRAGQGALPAGEYSVTVSQGTRVLGRKNFKVIR
ncbi:MAG: hypothetical protein J7M26_02300 [Armatimonadetes bacterium]|nr:hypothetical protein [Armatimonadota bacterium]